VARCATDCARQEQSAFEEQKFQHKKEYQRAMFDRQAALYFEAADTAAVIASTSDPVQRGKLLSVSIRFTSVTWLWSKAPALRPQWLGFTDAWKLVLRVAFLAMRHWQLDAQPDAPCEKPGRWTLES